MKRALSFIIALALMMSLMPTGLFAITANAETSTSGTCGSTLSWSLDGDGLLTISGTGEMTDYPAHIDTPWESQCTSIKSIKIGDGVTTIGDRAFFGCTRLTSVTIPNSVTSIGELAFKNCTRLTSIAIPDSVKTIGHSAFCNCTSLTGITIPNSITSIGQEAFYGCTSLSGVTMGDGVKEIGSYAFSNCTSLTSITIPNSVSYISTSVFSGCASLISVTIGDGVTYIKEYTFSGCTSLTNVTIGDGVEEIGRYAFKNCTSLTSITIPNRVRYISDWAFSDCTSLTSITIPNSVTYICTGTFYGCDRLTDIWYQGSYDEKNDILIYKENDYLESAIWHYNTCVEHTYSNCDVLCNNCEWIRDSDSRHTYDHNCDEQCNICGELRVVEHVYDDGCDTSCNLCETAREAPHNYKWIIDQEGSCGGSGIKHEECTSCYIKRNENTIIAATENHTFTDGNDIECNVCKQGFVLIQFNSNEGTGLSPIRTLSDQTTALPTAVPTRAGYNFTGWSTTKAGDALYQAGDSLQTDKSITLYAQWNKHCDSCAGTGKTKCNSCSGVGTKEVAVKCNECNGGKISCGGCQRWLYCDLDELNFETDANGNFGYRCPYCRNFGLMGMTGPLGQAFYECSTCYATGRIFVDEPCGNCAGSGIRDCTTCNGIGEVIRESVSAPAAPTLKNVTANTVTLKVITNGEYSMDGNVWQESPTFDNLEAGQVYHFYQRYAKTDTTYTSPSSSALTVLAHKHTFDNACDALCNFCEYTRTVPNHSYTANGNHTCNICMFSKTPEAPIVESKSHNSITLIPTVGFEYSKDGVVWQASNVFTNLSANTRYTFYQRVKASNIALVSATSAVLTVKTNEEPVYTVTFKNWDGRVISSNTYHYGDIVSVPADPTREADETYSYIFAGWDNDVAANCAGNATYTATYTPAYINYTVEFKDWNGALISTKTYHYGDKVTAPTNPTKAADNTYTYTFAGWDKNVVNCTGDATYTATYTSTYIDYTVVFKDWDGKVLSTKNYHWGDVVTAPATPAKVADNTYTYAFNGWDKPVVNCAGDATYTAKYTSTYIDYTVTFKNWDGSVLDSDQYHYNDTVTPPSATPTKPEDSTYKYVFKGWDSEIVKVIGNKIYTAIYDAIKKIVEITSNVFHIQGDSIGKVGTGTSASSFVSKVDQAENVKVYKGNTQISGNTAIGTGMEVKLMDGNTVVKSYTVVVTGDTNGDGAISVTDMIAVKAHVLKKTLLTGAYADAGDTSNDNAISITDFIQIKAQILGKSSIVPN